MIWLSHNRRQLAQGLLAGGIVLTLVGIVIVSHHPEGVVRAYARAAG
jgi:hypothetical protein